MACVIVTITEKGVQECRIPVVNLSQQKASRELLDKISPMVSLIHELVTGSRPTEEIPVNTSL